MKDFISAFILALGIAIAGIAISYGIYTFKSFDHYVSVKGLAEKNVKADQAIWRMQVNAADDDLNNVYQGINGAQNKMKAFLLKEGFNAADIQLDAIEVTDNRGVNYQTSSNSKRYTAQASVTLNTPQVDKVVSEQQQISSLVQEGVVLNNSRVTYLFTKLNDIKPQMLDDATANAKLAAESFAHNSHSQLGGIRSASQGLFTISDANGSPSYEGNSSVNKIVRVVTSVDYFLK